MKNFNSYFPPFWVKVIPIVLVLFCIGLTRTHAQNYKPLNEAIASVETALDNIKQPKVVGQTLNQSTPGTPKTDGMTPAQAAATNVIVFEVSYYQRFLELAKMNNEVAAAVVALDVEFPTAGQPASRSTTITTARGELLHLITY